MSQHQAFPIFVNCYNRLTPLLELLAWLERAQQHRIYLVDNASTYAPLLQFYEQTTHAVIRLGRNVGHQAVWEAGVIERYAPVEYYIATDPDIIPDEHCPLDVFAYFGDILERYPHLSKVGFGLHIDDLPKHYRHAAHVRLWEAQFCKSELLIEPGLYDAPIDTTLALYRPGVRYELSGARTGFPFLARHTAWYVNTDNPTLEERYYQQHIRPDINHWDGAEVPDRLMHVIQALSSAHDVVKEDEQ